MPKGAGWKTSMVPRVSVMSMGMSMVSRVSMMLEGMPGKTVGRDRSKGLSRKLLVGNSAIYFSPPSPLSGGGWI